jgi:uncharacterized protein (DUF608 family)
VRKKRRSTNHEKKKKKRKEKKGKGNEMKKMFFKCRFHSFSAAKNRKEFKFQGGKVNFFKSISFFSFLFFFFLLCISL